MKKKNSLTFQMIVTVGRFELYQTHKHKHKHKKNNIHSKRFYKLSNAKILIKAINFSNWNKTISVSDFCMIGVEICFFFLIFSHNVNALIRCHLLEKYSHLLYKTKKKPQFHVKLMFFFLLLVFFAEWTR